MLLSMFKTSLSLSVHIGIVFHCKGSSLPTEQIMVLELSEVAFTLGPS